MATIEVTNTNNTGAGSLRAAIQQANANSDADTIVFNASLSGQTIRLQGYDPATGAYQQFGGNGYLAITAGTVTISGDIDGDGVPDITISGDSDGDGYASGADNQAFRIGANAQSVTLDGLSIYGARGAPPPQAPYFPGEPIGSRPPRDGGDAVSAIGVYGGELILTDSLIAPGEAAATSANKQGDGGSASTIFISSGASATIDNVFFSNVRAYGGDGAGTGDDGVAVAGILNSGDLTLGNVGFDGALASGIYDFNTQAYTSEIGQAVVGVLNQGGTVRGLFGAPPTLFFGPQTGDTANYAVADAPGGVETIGLSNVGGTVSKTAVIGLAGSAADDDIDMTGGSNAFTIAGFFGDDQIKGGSVGDSLFGGSGDDTLRGRAGADRLNGDEGADILVGQRGDDSIFGGDGGDVLRGGGGGDRMRGQKDDDTMRGGGGDDRMGGNAGDDVMNGGAGSDKVGGGQGDDTLNGAGADDTVRGGGGDDSLLGGTGDDAVRGASGADTLLGGAGNDSLNGGGGSDMLTGGDGADMFLFFGAAGGDTVTDFQQGTDMMRIASANNFASLTITQDGADVSILYLGGSITALNQTAANFDATDFVF